MEGPAQRVRIFRPWETASPRPCASSRAPPPPPCCCCCQTTSRTIATQTERVVQTAVVRPFQRATPAPLLAEEDTGRTSPPPSPSSYAPTPPPLSPSFFSPTSPPLSPSFFSPTSPPLSPSYSPPPPPYFSPSPIHDYSPSSPIDFSPRSPSPELTADEEDMRYITARYGEDVDAELLLRIFRAPHNIRKYLPHSRHNQ